MKKILYLLLFLSGLFSYSKVRGQVEAPHGGQLKAVGYYYVEVVECYEFLEIYVYEQNMYPIRNRNLNGLVDFYYPDNSCMTSKLYPYGLDGFTAEVKRQCYASCEVELRGIGISLKAVFTGFGEKNEDCRRPESIQR